MNDTQYGYELLFQHCHEVEAQRDELLEILRMAVDGTPYPAGGCTCAVARMPPCGDCEQNSYTREWLDAARKAIAKAESEQ